MPLTIPVALTLATAALLVVHAPPLTASVNVVVVPVQTVLAPAIVPADGAVLTFTVVVALTLPQVAVTV